MWALENLTVEIDDELSIGSIVTVRIGTPAGIIQIMGQVMRCDDQVLQIDGANIDGAVANACGVRGLRAIGQKLMETADVQEIIVQGSARTSGANKGHIPRPFSLKRSKGPTT
jgi:hypothetical protein